MKRRRKIKHNMAPRALPPRLRAAILAAGGLVVLFLLVLLFYPRAQVMNSAEIAAIQGRGVLRVGVSGNAPGLCAEGEGLEAALARALAREIFPESDTAFTLELAPVTEHTALPKLKAGELDVILARMVDPGAQQYVCSASYYSDPVYFYCAEGSVGRTLGSQYVGMVRGSNEDEAGLFTAFNERNNASLQTIAYGSYPDLLDALAGGACDFIAMPASVARQMGAQGLPRHAEPLGALPYVAVTGADTPAIATLMTMLLDEYEQNGRLAQLCRENGL